MPQVKPPLLVLWLLASVALAAPLLGSSLGFVSSPFCQTHTCKRIAQDIPMRGIIEDRYKIRSQTDFPTIVALWQQQQLEGVWLEYGGADVWAWLNDGDSPNAIVRDLSQTVLGATWSASQIMAFAENCQKTSARVRLRSPAGVLTCSRTLGEYRAGWRTVLRWRRE
jgi:hypothetical protein